MRIPGCLTTETELLEFRRPLICAGVNPSAAVPGSLGCLGNGH